MDFWYTYRRQILFLLFSSTSRSYKRFAIPGAAFGKLDDTTYIGAMLRWAMGMPRRVMWSRSPLGTFVASSVVVGFGSHNGSGFYTPREPERERRWAEPGPWHSVYPMAPPYPWSVGAPPDSSRRRERWRLRRATDLLVNLIICANSYLVLHRPRVYPRALRVPRPPDTDVRRAVVAGLREDAALLFRPPHFFGGRGKAKLISTVELANSIFRAHEGDSISPPAGMASSPFVAARA